MAVTITEIANRAGVSIGTVSRVVNGKDKVHPNTRRTILRLIDETGYQPSALARGLASRRTGNLMLIVPNITDDYYPRLVRTITECCRQSERRVLLGVSDLDPAIERLHLEQVAQGTVDGLIVSSLQAPENVPAFLELAARGFPVVHLDVECLNPRMPTVKYDDFAAARMVTEHLLQKGHRRIAFCASAVGFQTVQDRHRGYQQTLRLAGVEPDERLSLMVPAHLEEWPMQRLIGLMRGTEPPTAVITENDMMAIACSHALGREGLRVPDDVAVAGFGNTYPGYLAERPLTSVALPIEDACHRAMQRFEELIKMPKEERCQAVDVDILPPRLVVGQTT